MPDEPGPARDADEKEETLSFDELEPLVPRGPVLRPLDDGPPTSGPVIMPLSEDVTAAPPVVQPVTGPSSATLSAPVHGHTSRPQVLQPIEFDYGDGAPEPPVLDPYEARTDVIDSAPVMVFPTGTQSHAEIELLPRYELTSVPCDDEPILGVMVELQARGVPLVDALSGPVAHVVLALDLSASMNHPEKYPVLKEAIGRMLDDLGGDDVPDVLVSIVLFSKGAEVLLRDVPARRIEKESLFQSIEEHELCFGRYTDVAGALNRAARIAYDHTRTSSTVPVRIYLLTDGKPQDMDLAHATVERAGKVVADMHALAFGADADVTILQDLFSGRRGGTVKSVRRDTIGQAFERVAEVAQYVVSNRCVVTLDLAPGVVGGDAFRYRPGRVRFPEPAFADGKRFRTDLGTVETDRTYSLLFELRVPESRPGVTPLGTVTAQIPGIGGPVTTRVDLTLGRSEAGSEPGDVDPAVRTARDILGALSNRDPQTALRALKLRRQLYEQERRDPGLLTILDKAIELLGTTGSLDGLSAADYATLMAHTCTSGSDNDRGFRA